MIGDVVPLSVMLSLPRNSFSTTPKIPGSGLQFAKLGALNVAPSVTEPSVCEYGVVLFSVSEIGSADVPKSHVPE
jgi:hypothetical protein